MQPANIENSTRSAQREHGTGEAVVWCVDLDGFRSWAASVAYLLFPPGMEPAIRRCDPLAEGRVLAASAAVRLVLGACLNRLPKDLVLVKGPFGKPGLLDCAQGFDFNLSHDGGLALIAAAFDAGPVGVDLVRVHAWPEMGAVARHFFTARERSALDEAPDLARARLFARLWARKEAALKALGCGLALDPGLIDALDDRIGSPPVVALFDLDIGFGRAAALGLGLETARVRCLRWPVLPADDRRQPSDGGSLRISAAIEAIQAML